MLVIRFFRVGKKNQPSFKIVVTDKRKPPRAGRFIEEVGFYNPLTKEKVLREERIKYWLSVGAKPSDTVHNLLIKENILEEKKISLHKKAKKKKGKETAPTESVAEKPAEEKPPVEKKPKEEIKETPKVLKEELAQEAPKTKKPEKEKIPPGI